MGVKLDATIHRLPVPLKLSGEKIWEPLHFISGRTKNLDSFTFHESALAAGASPHPPHRHDDEELLLVLFGNPEIVIHKSDNKNQEEVSMSPGDFAYYPDGFRHTIRNPGAETANYMMLRWGCRSLRPNRRIDKQHIIVKSDAYRKEVPTHFGTISPVFEFRTRWLSKLHCHITNLLPREGYNPHIDEHDVFIIVQEGRIHTLGEDIDPYGSIHIPAGQSHAMLNPSDSPARYLVFEFHGNSFSRHFIRVIADIRNIMRKTVRRVIHIQI